MRWAQGRQTKEKEDRAYCPLGIFKVYMPLLYGEGDHAFRRLQKEIDDLYGGYTTVPALHDSSQQPTQIKHLGLCLASAPLIQPSEFVGRAAEIAAIRDILQADEFTTQQRRAVVGGMGGVCKTQLAIAYSWRYGGSYTSTLLLNASSEAALYVSLRSVVSILTTTNEKLDNQQLLIRLHQWLSDHRNTRWLLVLDNHDDPNQFRINHFYPTVGHGSIIVTTRLPDEVMGSPVRVRPFTTIDDSLDILQVRSGRRNVKDNIGARRLAERMAGLPLALVTAAAYLRKNTLSFQQYLDVYVQRWQVDRRPLQLQEYTDCTLYNTWNLSYSRLMAVDREATQMLQLLAYFDHQTVWYELVRAGLSDDSPPWLNVCFAEQVGFESLMGRLVDYRFIEV